jgi:hypothetical protein
LLEAPAANKYNCCVAIEYEAKPENPLGEIKVRLAESQKAIGSLG